MSRTQQGFDASLRRLSLAQQQPSSILRKLRCEAELSQRALARRAEVAANTVRNAELGHIPLIENQQRIAMTLTAALGRPVDRLELWPMVNGEAA